MGQQVNKLVKTAKAKMSEHQLQSLCVRWFRYQYPEYQYMLFAVPNGVFFGLGGRGYAYSNKLKDEGVLNGVADLILLKSNAEYGALCIEMKVGSNKQSTDQIMWQFQAECNGNKYVVCRTYEEFKDAINNYLTNGEN